MKPAHRFVWFLPALLAMFWAGAALAVSVVDLSASNRDDLQRAISHSVESDRSGTWHSWHGGGGLHGLVSPGPAFSEATHQSCSRCSDPCRTVMYTIKNDSETARYAGERCREVVQGADGLPNVEWRSRSADRLIAYTPVQVAPMVPDAPPSGKQVVGSPETIPPPVPQPKQNGNAHTATVVATRIQEGLKALLYYDGAVDGDFGPSTKQATTAFLADEKSSLPPVPSAALLQLVGAANGRAHSGHCPEGEGNYKQGFTYVACATLAP